MAVDQPLTTNIVVVNRASATHYWVSAHENFFAYKSPEYLIPGDEYHFHTPEYWVEGEKWYNHAINHESMAESGMMVISSEFANSLESRPIDPSGTDNHFRSGSIVFNVPIEKLAWATFIPGIRDPGTKRYVMATILVREHVMPFGF